MWRLPAQMIFAVKKKATGAKHFRRACDKKINVLAMAAMLSVADEALPAEVATGLGQLMAGLLKLLIALKAQQVPSHRCQLFLAICCWPKFGSLYGYGCMLHTHRTLHEKHSPL